MEDDGFTLVKGGRQAKKRKPERSLQLNSLPGASSVSPSNTPAPSKPSSFKNTIPVILSDVDPKFNSKVNLMSELKQFHPNIKVSKVLERKSNSFLIIEDTPTRHRNSTKWKQNEGLSRPKSQNKFAKSLPNR